MNTKGTTLGYIIVKFQKAKNLKKKEPQSFERVGIRRATGTLAATLWKPEEDALSAQNSSGELFTA